MQISRHEETQAHSYGLCSCPAEPHLTLADVPASRWSHDEDTDDDNLDAPRPSRRSGRPQRRY